MKSERMVSIHAITSAAVGLLLAALAGLVMIPPVRGDGGRTGTEDRRALPARDPEPDPGPGQARSGAGYTVVGHGRRLDLEAADAELTEVLVAMGEAARLKIDVGRWVAGRVTLSFRGRRLKSALRSVLQSAGDGRFIFRHIATGGGFMGFGDERIVVLRKLEGLATLSEMGVEAFPETRGDVRSYLRERFNATWDAEWGLDDRAVQPLVIRGLVDFGVAGFDAARGRETIDRLLPELEPVLGVERKSLVETDAGSNDRYVRYGFAQLHRGVPVVGGTLVFGIDREPTGRFRAVIIDNATFAGIGTDIVRVLDETAARLALRAVQVAAAAPRNGETEPRARMVIFPLPHSAAEKGAGRRFPLAWEFRSGENTVYVDAVTGAVIAAPPPGGTQGKKAEASQTRMSSKYTAADCTR